MQAFTESAREYQNNVLLVTLDSWTALLFLWKILMVSVKLLVLGYAFLINRTVWKDPWFTYNQHVLLFYILTPHPWIKVCTRLTPVMIAFSILHISIFPLWTWLYFTVFISSVILVAHFSADSYIYYQNSFVLSKYRQLELILIHPFTMGEIATKNGLCSLYWLPLFLSVHDYYKLFFLDLRN